MNIDNINFILYNNRSKDLVDKNLPKIDNIEEFVEFENKYVFIQNLMLKDKYYIEFKKKDVIEDFKDIIFTKKDLNKLENKINKANLNIKKTEEYKYLKQRYITDKDIFKYKIAPLSFDFTKRERELIGSSLHPSLKNILNFDKDFNKGIVIPIYEGGNIVNFIVRRLVKFSPIKYSLSIPEVTVIGLDEVSMNDEVWITEGFFDKIALDNNGFENVITVSSCLWSSIQLYQLYLKSPKRVNIFADYDYSGLRGAWLLERFLKFYNVEVCVYISKKCKDADEHFRKSYGKEDIEQIFITQSLLDIVDEMDDMFDNYIDYLKNKEII